MNKEIKGWVGTNHRGNLSIEYKNLTSVMIEDLGYSDIAEIEVTESEDGIPTYDEDDSFGDGGSLFNEYFEEIETYDDVEEEDDNYRRLEESELNELVAFFVGGKEIESQGDTMVFLLDEESAETIDDAITFIASIKVGR